MSTHFDVCIQGAGVVGQTLALLLARERLRVALVGAVPTAVAAATPAAPDPRAYALNAASRQLLEAVRGWPDPSAVCPVLAMQVQGDDGGNVVFTAAEQAVPALAWIVDVPGLLAALHEALRYQPLVEHVLQPQPAALTVICEGRASASREALGAGWSAAPYEQSAIALRLETAQAHGQIARQWFGAHEVLAFLPLAQPHRVAVVWSVAQARVADLLAQDDAALAQQLGQLSGLALGELHPSSARQAWPLQHAQAQRWVGQMPGTPQQSWALAGDAAHAVHPMAGQGLNFGLADAATLSDLISRREYWRAISDLRLLRQYQRSRKAAMWAIDWGTDGLQQLFAQPHRLAQNLRNWGMAGFDRSGPLKRWVARLAIGQS